MNFIIKKKESWIFLQVKNGSGNKPWKLLVPAAGQSSQWTYWDICWNVWVSSISNAKIVCSNWYLCSKQTLRPKFRSPLVMLCPKEGGCNFYNPEKDMVYVAKSDLSGYQFLGNSRKWFLVVDSKSDLYIIDATRGCYSHV